MEDVAEAPFSTQGCCRFVISPIATILCIAVLFCGAVSSVRAQESPSTNPPSQAPPELIIDQIKKAVVFLEGTYSATQTRSINGAAQHVVGPATLSGTGFFIYVADPRLGPQKGDTFLVTNKHMIREPGVSGTLGEGPYFSSLVMRVNTKQALPDGSRFANIPVTGVDTWGSLEWFVDSDETVDLAIRPVRLDSAQYDFKTIQSDLFATKDLLMKERVNENDEILFAGLFTWSPGAKKNYPIVRHGKLARLLEEPIPLDRSHPDKTVDVHLAEVMSFGGNSGSPVFLRLGGVREGSGMSLGYSYYLLGVMQGFFPEGMDFAIQVAQLRGLAAQNSGLAAVIPAEKIVEILNGPRCNAYRERVAGSEFSNAGNMIDAEKSFMNAIAILEKSSPQHVELSATLFEYARLLRRTNRLREAESAERRANAILSNVSNDRLHPRS